MGWFIYELLKVKLQTNVINVSVRTLFKHIKIKISSNKNVFCVCIKGQTYRIFNRIQGGRS